MELALVMSAGVACALRYFVRNGARAFGSTARKQSTPPSWRGAGCLLVALLALPGAASAAVQPTITSATYDASTGTLAVDATNMTAGDAIDVGKFTLTGEGGSTYTLTGSPVAATSATFFSIALSGTDAAALGQIVNRNGTSSSSGTTYNLAAANGWETAVTSVDTSDLVNGLSASNVAVPRITSATYNGASGAFVVTGTGFSSRSGAGNDIVANKFTVTGEGGATYTLTDTANAEITSGTSFTLIASFTDRAAIDQILNRNGISSTSGTTYNLAAAEDWAAGADAAVAVVDAVGNGLTVSNVAVPTIASATYNAPSGTLVVTGSGLKSSTGANNDIVANRFTVTGEGGSTYTLTDTANVEITSGTSFTLVASATDRAGINLILNKNGTSSTGGTAYNLAAAEDWAAGADAAVVVADTAGNAITAFGVVPPPTVSSVGVPANATYISGQNLDFTVNFSAAVLVDTSGGTPRLAITLDSGAVNAIYVSGSGTSALLFRYTIASGNQDADGLVVGTVSANGGTVRDAGGKAANLTLNNVGSTAGVLVDGVAPVVASINRVTAATSNASSVDFTVTFSENVSGVDASDFSLTATGTASGSVALVTQVDASTYTVGVNGITGDGTLRLDLNGSGTGISDIPGNTIATGYSAGQAYVVDHTAPAVASVGVPANGTYIAASNLDFTVNFNEAVTVTGTPGIAVTLQSGTVTAVYVSGSGSSALVFRYTVASGDSDSDGIAIGTLSANGGTLRDAAGNDASLTLNSVGSTAGVLIDAAGPTATIVVADAALSVGETSIVTFTFSEPVTGFSLADVTVANGTLSGLSSSNGGITWTAIFTPTALITDASNLVTLDNTGVQDGSGTPGVGTTNSNNYAIDTAPPIASIIVADTSLTPGETSTVTFTFSEAVTGFTNADLTIANGTLGAVSSTDGGVTWTATFTPTAGIVDASNVITLDNTGVADAAGNVGTGTTDSNNYAVLGDATAPVVLSVGVPANATYLTGQVLDFTINFSEAVTVDTSGGTPAFAITLDSGAVNATYVAGSGTSALLFRYTVASADHDSDGIVVGALSANGAMLKDAAGNDAVLTLNSVGNTAGVLVGPSPQLITFGAQAARSFVPSGTFALNPVAMADSGLAVAYSSQTAATCTISGTTVTMLSAGTCTIAADQAGDATHAPAPTVVQSIAISLAAQTITFGAQGAQTFVAGGTFVLTPTATASSGLAVAYSSQSAAVCTISGSTVTMVAAGTCIIAAEQPGNANYAAAATVTQSIAIGKAAQAITFGAQPAQTFVAGGTFELAPVATSDSGLAVSYTTQTASVCTISGTTVTMLSAGSCTIAADQPGDDNHAAATTVSTSIAIARATQAIGGFAANPSAPVFAPNGTFAVSATGGASGNPVVFGSTTPAVCSVAGATVTMVSAGSCMLTANQAGNASYTPAAQANLQVTIAAAAPTLSWIGPLQKVLGEAAFELPEPASNSAGGFAFTSQNPAVATVSGREVTITGPGVATLVATQAANGNYAQGSISTTLVVSSRPDPTHDPDVVGGLQAQVDTSVRFASAQLANIHDRLRQLRTAQGNPSANNLTVSVNGGSGPGLSLNPGQLVGDMPQSEHGWGLWTAGTVALGKRDVRTGANGFDFRSDGVTFGADRRYGHDVVLGVAGGLGWNNTDFDGSPSQQDTTHRSVALYGLWHGNGQLFVDGLMGLGRLDFDLTRWSEVAGSSATAQRSGDQVFGSLTFGYEHAGKHSHTTGYGRFDASRTTLDAYQESGLGLYDLSYDEQSVRNSTVALGVEGSYTFKMTAAALHPYWSVEYRQALQNNGEAGLNYVVQPLSQGYMLGLRSYNDDTLTLGAGLDIDLDSGWSFSFLFGHEQSSGAGNANTFGLRASYGHASPMDWRNGSVPGAPGSAWMPAAQPDVRPPATH